MLLQTWKCINSLSRGQHHSKVTPALGRGEDNHTHQSHCDPSSGLEADCWSDYRAHQPKETSQGPTQEKHPAVECYHLWETPGLIQLKPKATPDLPTNSIGTKRCPQLAKRAIEDDWTEGNSGSATTLGAHNTQETPKKHNILVNRGQCTVGHCRISSS